MAGMLDFGRRQLISQEDSAVAHMQDVPRSRFIGRWSRKMTFDAGGLYPFMIDEILPGDHMSYEATAYVRMSTPVFPLMDSQRIDTHFFYVPNRIIWRNWNRFMGEQENPTDSITLYTVPQVTCPPGGSTPGDFWDYFGIPNYRTIDPVATIQVNVLPLLAYMRIWNDWFRDQNIDDSINLDPGLNGPYSYNANVSMWAIKFRRKAHDYFTSALPWPQKFTAPNVAWAGTGQAPVLGIGSLQTGTGFLSNQLVNETIDSGVTYPNSRIGSGFYIKTDSQTNTTAKPQIYAQLTGYANITVNALREAFLVQNLLEQDARGGSRYVEIIRSHFGVTSPDFRIQRPEYIGGGSTPMGVTPIAQTAPGTGSVVGQLGGAGTAIGQHRASYAATEHGYILGLISVRSELSYSQGLHRMWTRKTRYDFYWPALAGLGEQAILRKEIYTVGTPALDDTVFGYQERWQEYRTRYSEITGYFRSNITGTLDAWHLAQNFTSAPVLNSTFLNDNPPMSRVLAAGSNAQFQQYLADIEISRQATRPIPTFGAPVTLGRF